MRQLSLPMPRPVRPAPAAPQRAGARPAGRLRCACGGTCPRCVQGVQGVQGVQATAGTRGQPLPADLRTPMAASLGAPLEGVRLHTGAEAAALAGAQRTRAVTVGDDIFFGAGHFDPRSAGGRQLIAHELVHVAQQRRGAGPGGAASEAEAHALAPTLAAGRPVRVAQGAPVGVQREEPAAEDPDAAAREAFDRSFAQALTGSQAPAQQPEATPLPRAWFTPSLIGVEAADLGSLFTPYYNRGIMPNSFGDTRDVDLVFDLFRSRLALTRTLPDIGFVARPLFGTDWRTGLALKLTSATVDAALSGDHPTVFDISNRDWAAQTGASTTMMPFSVPVPVLNGLWNRFSGGGW